MRTSVTYHFYLAGFAPFLPISPSIPFAGSSACRPRNRGSGVEMGMCAVLQRNGTMTIEFGLSPYVCLCGVRSVAPQHMMLLWWFKWPMAWVAALHAGLLRWKYTRLQ